MSTYTPWHLVGVTSWATQGPIRPETVYIISDEAEPRKGKKALACAFNKEHAHLIAAAPELLAALDRAIQDIDAGWATEADERFPWLADARAAIAKAEGGAS